MRHVAAMSCQEKSHFTWSVLVVSTVLQVTRQIVSDPHCQEKCVTIYVAQNLGTCDYLYSVIFRGRVGCKREKQTSIVL